MGVTPYTRFCILFCRLTVLGFLFLVGSICYLECFLCSFYSCLLILLETVLLVLTFILICIHQVVVLFPFFYPCSWFVLWFSYLMKALAPVSIQKKYSAIILFFSFLFYFLVSLIILFLDGRW